VYFWIGLLLNSAATTFVLTIAMQIPCLIITYEILKYRESKIKPLSVSRYLPFESLELTLRAEYKKKNADLLPCLISNYELYQNQLNLIVQSYYCYDGLKNCTLALNKILFAKNIGINIPLNYQIYKCKKMMIAECENSSDTYNAVLYFVRFEKVKELDKKFCITYFKFIDLFDQKRLSINKIKEFMKDIIENLKNINKEYNLLSKKYPGTPELAEYYSSFLIKIAGNFSKGRRIMTLYGRGQSLTALDAERRNFIFSENRCFAVFSGNKETSGKLLYYNKQLLEFLKITRQDTSEVNLVKLVPVYGKYHHEILAKFIKRSTDHIAFINQAAMLLDSQGFLCEAAVNIECVGYMKTINFISSIDPVRNRDREFAVVSEFGFIYNHSAGFAETILVNRNKVEEQNIDDLFPQLHFTDLVPDTVKEIKCYISVNNEPIIAHLFFILRTVSVKNTKINVLFSTKNEIEANSWKTLNTFFMSKTNPRANQNSSIEEVKDEPDLEISVGSDFKSKEESVLDRERSLADQLSHFRKSNKKASRAFDKSQRVINASKYLLLISVN
jgi:hypothetical protein